MESRELVAQIHQAGIPGVIAVTGGGGSILASLLSVPGASRTVLEALVPYDTRSLAQFVGTQLPSACSPEAARRIAQMAYERAKSLASGEVFGLGLTAALATDRPRRGEHRFHLAIIRHSQICEVSLSLAKDQRDRVAEEAVLQTVVLNSLAKMLGLTEKLSLSLIPGEIVQEVFSQRESLLSRLLAGEIAAIYQSLDGGWQVQASPPGILLPGSFNPLHLGHWQLAKLLAARTGQSVAFELSLSNVDKPALSEMESRRRASQFVWKSPLWLTQAPTFLQKSRIFPGVGFAVGIDTAIRLLAGRYYLDEAARDTALRQLRDTGCTFYVAGRTDASRRFLGLSDVDVPTEFRQMFVAIPESEFRLDISSTQLRENGHSM